MATCKTPSKSPSVLSQTFPPAPTLTESNLGSLSGKVVLITGATSGIGYELAKILYESGATVHITGRSEATIGKALANLKSGSPRVDGGAVHGWQLDLSDLSSIKNSAALFLASTQRLDVVFHNAGVMKPPKGSKTKLGHDLEMGTNCLGPYLLNHFLEPLLQGTVGSAPKASVRVIWLSSMVAVGTVSEGIQFERDGTAPMVLDNAMQNYMQSKVGNAFLAHETSKRMGSAGVINVSVHPGFLATQLNRHSSGVQQRVMGAMLKPAIFGAYTELWAGFSPLVTTEQDGQFIVPWGRFGTLPPNIEKGLRTTNYGGPGLAEQFSAWCQKETKPYM